MLDIFYINYNSSDLIVKSIASIHQNNGTQPFNVFVWDNNSDDNVNQIKNLYPDTELFVSRNNVGFSKGINQLLEKSSSEYLVFLNPDTEVINNNLLDKSINFLEANPDVGVIGPKVLNGDSTIQGSARKFPTPLTSLFGRTSLLTKLFPRNSISAKNICTINNSCIDPIEVDWVSGACMFARREAIEAVGGFDERFFLYWEDADLCRRIWDAGWKVIYYPEIEIYHFVGKSSNFSPYRSICHFHKSCYYLCEKNAPHPLSPSLIFSFFGLAARCMTALLFYSFKSQLRKKAHKKTIHKSK